jgi:hypothetical protein
MSFLPDTGPDRGEAKLVATAQAAGGGTVAAAPAEAGFYDNVPDLAGKDLMQMMVKAERVNQQVLGEVRPLWNRAHRAFQNKHFAKSKYLSDAFKPRSKLFRPKTRTTVIKNMATAQTALFSTDDAVSVKAQLEDDNVKRASAAVIHQTLNYRLTRSSPRGGIPWFQVAMGACFDSQIHGICVSKQYWDYLEARRTKKRTIDVPVMDGDLPVVDAMGQAVTEPQEEEYEEIRVVRDRPMIKLIPPENVYIDVGAPFDDVVQGAAYFVARFPMTIEDVKSMMSQQNPKAPVEWLPIPADGDFNSATNAYAADGSIRQERDTNKTLGGRFDRNIQPVTDDYRIVWVHENFARFHGCDYQWWTLGTKTPLSKVAYTEDVYPAQQGDRPYSYGFASIEPHVLQPMAPVESWQPLQQEINDTVNLRLDGMKQAIEPLTKIKQGSIFDAKQLRNRGAAGATIIVRDMEDIEFDRPPDVPASAYQEMQYMNVDFDELAGVFGGGSVQSNRSLNETVGGMRLLAGAANATAEFNLRVWSETWVEPTLRQTTQNIQFYETDEVVLGVAGERAKLIERYGISEINDALLAHEVDLRVNVGQGATDPMARMAKFAQASEITLKAAGAFDRMVKVNAEEFIREVYGTAGHKDGLRFFTLGKPGEEGPPPPEVQKEQMKQEAEAAKAQAKIASDEKVAAANNQTKLEVVKLEGRLDAMMEMMKQQFAAQSQEREFAAADQQQARGFAVDTFKQGRQFVADGQKQQRQISADDARDHRKMHSDMERDRMKVDGSLAKEAMRPKPQIKKDGA